ncbi:hypothetical protein [Ligilactobacillus apodemi]|uniref:Uncharacterized protein n=1 Tax=Ligilactobacillus apodemi DSM 16634 = JCM 16172 TaxID=1423724 RepID=A0A0R1TRA0_9LACO|nr:hypothetical protein [Ligilactobacillus apodemi]KRL83943.1 hypothetical protein FC32_GL001213 [Ligilactobacillus apodemi DSM 16634 = JCM 16172]
MKYSKLVASLMLSTTILSTASLVLADEVKTKGMPEQSSSVKVNTKMSEKPSGSSSTAKVDQTTDKSQAEDKTKDSSTETQNDPIQTLKEQKMIIKKIIAKGGSKMATVTANSDTSNSDDNSKTLGVSESDLKGVPNSKFVVYDVTDLMSSIIKEKLGISDEDMLKVTDTDKVDQTNESSKRNDVSKESKSSNVKDSEIKKETITDSSEKTEETSEKRFSKAESSINDETDQKSDTELSEKVK